MKLFAQPGAQGELKKPPELDQRRQLFSPYASDFKAIILPTCTNLLRNFSSRRCFCLHVSKTALWERRQKFLTEDLYQVMVSWPGPFGL
jgi:hypothetical protein